MNKEAFGIIEKITAYPAKGEEGIDLSEALLIENFGLKGDFHAGVGEKQISMLCAETLEELRTQKDKGFCFSRFKENITIRNLPSVCLRSGVRLRTGETMLEISGKTKHCYRECSFYETGKTCPLAGKSLFSKVLKGGLIRIGDKVEAVYD